MKFKHQIFKRVIPAVLAITAVCSFGFTASAMQFPENGDQGPGRTIDQVIGCTRNITEYLKTHENDDFYLGTPYNGDFSADRYVSYSPNGDVWPGHSPGLNCTGFVAHTLASCGGDLSIIENNNTYQGTGGFINASNWNYFVRENSITSYRFDSVQGLLDSGLARKGDIVYFEPSDTVWTNHQDQYGNAADCHIGIFWGDTPSENKWWHSSHPVNNLPNSESLVWGNQIGPLVGKCDDCVVYLFPTNSGGKVKLKKVSARPDYTDGNACYDLTGAEYGIYTDAACTNQIETLTVQDNGGVTNLSEVHDAGTYYTKELKASKGYNLNPHVMSFTIENGNMDKLVEMNSPEMREPPLDDPIAVLVEKSFKDWNK